MADGKVIKLIPEEITEAPDGLMIQIVTRAFETQDEFIFETIRPFCETQAHMAITKDELIRALTLLREQEPVEPLHKCVGSGSNTLIANASYAYCPFCGRRIERHD